MLVIKALALASPAQPKSPRAKANRKTPKPQPQRPKPLQPKPLQPKSLLRAEVELSCLLVDVQEVQGYEGSGFAGNGQDGLSCLKRFIDHHSSIFSLKMS